MHIAVDIILLAVFVITVLNGYRRGFIKTAFGLVGIFVALWAASAFSSQLGSVMDDAFIHDAVEETITSSLTEAFEDGGADKVTEIISEFAPTKEIENRLTETYMQKGRESIEAISDELSERVSSALGNAIAFFVIFLIAYIVVKLASFILDKFFRLPILNAANRWLGILMGMVTAVLLLMVISRSFECVLPWLNKTYTHLFPSDLADKTVLYGFFCRYNLFSALIVGVVGFIS